MAASDHLGPQWSQPELSFTVHRGLTRKPQTGRWLGMHWSADPAVARRFAGSFGHVVHAEVPMSSVETDPQTLSRERVIDDSKVKEPYKQEKEVPVTIGKPVKVTGVSGPEADKETGNWNGVRRTTPNSITATTAEWQEAMKNKRPARKRTYKKPREMKA